MVYVYGLNFEFLGVMFWCFKIYVLVFFNLIFGVLRFKYIVYF
jgi:hypothetical protein